LLRQNSQSAKGLFFSRGLGENFALLGLVNVQDSGMFGLMDDQEETEDGSSLPTLSLPFLALDDGIFNPKLNRSARSRFNPRRKC
jgi:hypothetical protein